MRAFAIAAGLACLAPAALAQDRLPEFASALHLRPDQAAAYRTYLRQTAPDAAFEARRAAESRRLAQMTTPERIDWTRAQLRSDLAAMDRQGAAVKRFYRALTPEQRRTFDQLTLPAR